MFFLVAFDYCRFCVVVRFFQPRHNGQWPPTSKDFYPRFDQLHFLTILILEKEQVFPFFNVECQTRVLLVPFLWRLMYDAVLDWGLNLGPPALDASTIPLGYRGGGGGILYSIGQNYWYKLDVKKMILA